MNKRPALLTPFVVLLLSLSAPAQAQTEAAHYDICAPVLVGGVFNVEKNVSDVKSKEWLFSYMCSKAGSTNAQEIGNASCGKNGGSSSFGAGAKIPIKGIIFGGNLNKEKSWHNEYCDKSNQFSLSKWHNAKCTQDMASRSSSAVTHQFISKADSDVLKTWETCVREKINADSSSTPPMLCYGTEHGELIKIIVKWKNDYVDYLKVKSFQTGNLKFASTGSEAPTKIEQGGSVWMFERKDYNKTSLFIASAKEKVKNGKTLHCSYEVPSGKCKNPQWYKKASSECSFLGNHTGVHMDCGADKYKVAKTSSCGEKQHSIHHWTGKCSACGGTLDQLLKDNPGRRPNYGCREYHGKECRWDAFLYKECRHESHGAESFKSCAHPSFGPRYAECRHESHGMEKCLD
jgi:hypothetical protein